MLQPSKLTDIHLRGVSGCLAVYWHYTSVRMTLTGRSVVLVVQLISDRSVVVDN